MQDTKLVRTSVDGDPHTLVLRRTSGDTSPFGPLFDLLPETGPSDVLAVTYQRSDKFLQTWRERIDRRPRNVGVVSVGERMRSASPASESTPRMPDRPVVRGVADSTDVDGVRDVTAGYLDAWPDDGHSFVYFDSVTALLAHLDADATVDFLETYLRALDARDAVGYFCLTPAAHDRSIVRETASLFDTVLECVDAAAEVEAEPSVSDCFEAIADRRRRYVLGAIAGGEEVSVAELADHVAGRTSAGRRRIQASLVNVHLPKLADLGVVAYDRERGRVAPSHHFEWVVPYLRKATDVDTSRPTE